MQLSDAQVFINGEPLGTVMNVELTPVGKERKIGRLPRLDQRIEFEFKMEPNAWAERAKAMSRIHTLEVTGRLPFKKGRTVTLEIQGVSVTDILYHVRKPRRDSERRIYYIREEFADIPEAA